MCVENWVKEKEREIETCTEIGENILKKTQHIGGSLSVLFVALTSYLVIFHFFFYSLLDIRNRFFKRLIHVSIELKLKFNFFNFIIIEYRAHMQLAQNELWIELPIRKSLSPFNTLSNQHLKSIQLRFWVFCRTLLWMDLTFLCHAPCSVGAEKMIVEGLRQEFLLKLRSFNV